jgi:hypothetical protein
MNGSLIWRQLVDQFDGAKNEIHKGGSILLAKGGSILGGVEESGIAMSLLRLALLNGYRGRFYNAQDMLDELYASLADKTTSKLLNRVSNYDVIVIDELGYLTLTSEQINIFLSSLICGIKRGQQ